jgi:RNA polymerase sigma factor (sigma-70 family)
LHALLRELTPLVLGVVARRFGDFAAAEDAVQEALIAADAQWPQQGIPQNPRAWLTQVALRRMTDHVRSESARRRRESETALDADWTAPAADTEPVASGESDALTLFFMCCHPSLTTSSAIALALRALGGLTTAEIARAFLVPEATMAQRISRAKGSIKSSGVPFQLPSPEDRAHRLRTVLHVLYLIFNEGYASGGTRFQRPELSAEAIRLTRSLCALLPDDSEAAGLLALMLLTDARRAARSRPDDELIPLDRQDRSVWDRAEIAEGTSLLENALSKGIVGPYQLQAAIAALHDTAASAEETDWPQILALYELLKRISDNPMVRLNHGIAAAMVHGPSKGLALLGTLDEDPHLAGHYRLHAARAHLLQMVGDLPAAISHFRAAAGKTSSVPERDYLIAQAARLSADA